MKVLLLLAWLSWGFAWLALSRAPGWACQLAVLAASALLAVVWPPVGAALIAAQAASFLAFGVPPLRRRWLSMPLLAWFRRALPPLSDTEKEAIAAGTVWFDRELFSGAPDWRRLLETPPAALDAREQAFLDGPTETLCRMLDDWQITDTLEDLPAEVWDFMKRERFFGMIIPERYGGLGFSAAAHSAVVMKIASRSVTAAVTVMVPNSLGPAELLLKYGTDAQREHHLPRLARGEDIPCFALTGPYAGSDAASLPDRGVVCWGEHEGQRVLGLRVDWEKRYITLGPVATLLGLAFRAYDPDHLLGDREDLGITCALVPTDTPGVEIGDRHLPLNIPFMNGPNRGRGVFIPLDWVIGGRDGVGEGWRMLMSCLAAGRAISLPALSVAAGKSCARFVGAYARIRHQFKLPIGRFEGVQEPLARIAGLTYLMDAARALTAAALDQGEKPTVLSALLKYHNTEAMRQVVNDGMDVLGGKGICLGPRNFLGRTYQALPISITVEGANILTRSMIVFGQGAFRSHPFVREEIEALEEPDPRAALARFDRAVAGHIGHVLRITLRAVFSAYSGGRGLAVPARGPLRRHWQRLARYAAAYAVLVDSSLLLLGGSLKRRERLSARFADALGALYYASAAIKRYHDQGQPAEDWPLLEWSLQWALHRLESALLGLLDNHPSPWAARLLRVLLFPRRGVCRPPADALDARLAEVLLNPGPARERLTAGIYLDDRAEDVTGAIEHAFAAVHAAAEAEARLRRQGVVYQGPGDEAALAEAVAAGVIDAADAEALRRAAEAAARVIAVDAFAPWPARPPRPVAEP